MAASFPFNASVQVPLKGGPHSFKQFVDLAALVQNIVRLSALAFGVRKLVSLKANELCAKVVLYNPKLDDMAEIFRIRSVQVTAFLGLDDSHDCFQKVLVEINKCWEGYDRCTDRPCALPTFKGIGSMRFPLNRWQIILKADVLQANKLLRNWVYHDSMKQDMAEGTILTLTLSLIVSSKRKISASRDQDWLESALVEFYDCLAR
jgi:hypothetical protein